MGSARPEPVLRLSKGLSKDNPCAVFRPTRAISRPLPRHTGESQYPEGQGNGVRSS